MSSRHTKQVSVVNDIIKLAKQLGDSFEININEDGGYIEIEGGRATFSIVSNDEKLEIDCTQIRL